MSNFIEDFWEKNAALWGGADKIVTRFPPEPNGFSHLGHCKAEMISFGMAEKFGGRCNLRMDDTNPEKESDVYAKNIIEMTEWLGFKWAGDVKHASDYFDDMFGAAKDLVRRDLAYMDFTPREKVREMRGTLKEGGSRSKDAENPIEWHLGMFERMAAGEFDEGACVLRAKIDMASPNINMRDPVIYRVKKVPHPRTGAKWVVYPAYSYAHPLEDLIEGVTLSLCTLEFEDLRPFYNWVIEKCEPWFRSEGKLPAGMKHVPVELEFARLELDRGVTSKRKINALVEEGKVDGWDDPRLVTLAGLRRRGFTPSALRKFCEEAGVSKANSITPFSRIEDFLRLDLDESAPRRIVVARPVMLDVLEGMPHEPTMAEAPNHPKKPEMGMRPYEISWAMWIDRDDVRMAGTAEKGFKRVEPGSVFRIMHGPVLECVEVGADDNGVIMRVVAKVSGKKPKATIHGLSRGAAVPVDIWEPEVIANEETDPKNCLVIRKGFAEPMALETTGTWHAPRYGYLTEDARVKGRLILSAKLRSGV